MTQGRTKNINQNGQTMRAVTTAGGSVMFVPDELPKKKQKSRPFSYKELIDAEMELVKATKKKAAFSYKDLIDAELAKLKEEQRRPLTALERLEKFAERVAKIVDAA